MLELGANNNLAHDHSTLIYTDLALTVLRRKKLKQKLKYCTYVLNAKVTLQYTLIYNLFRKMSHLLVLIEK